MDSIYVTLKLWWCFSHPGGNHKKLPIFHRDGKTDPMNPSPPWIDPTRNTGGTRGMLEFLETEKLYNWKDLWAWWFAGKYVMVTSCEVLCLPVKSNGKHPETSRTESQGVNWTSLPASTTNRCYPTDSVFHRHLGDPWTVRSADTYAERQLHFLYHKVAGSPRGALGLMAAWANGTDVVLRISKRENKHLRSSFLAMAGGFKMFLVFHPPKWHDDPSDIFDAGTGRIHRQQIPYSAPFSDKALSYCLSWFNNVQYH